MFCQWKQKSERKKEKYLHSYFKIMYYKVFLDKKS